MGGAFGRCLFFEVNLLRLILALKDGSPPFFKEGNESSLLKKGVVKPSLD
jgi:hypothetical protein